MTVLLGAGEGTFGAGVAYGVGEGPSSVAVADLNGDNVPDLVTANSSVGTVTVLMAQ